MRFLDEIAEEVAAERRGAAMAPARRNGGGFLDEIAEEVRRERAVEAAPVPSVLPAPDRPNILTRIATPIARSATGLARSVYDIITSQLGEVPEEGAPPRRDSGVTGTWDPDVTALEAGASPSELVAPAPPRVLPGPLVQPGVAAAVTPPPAVAPVPSQVEVRRQAPGAAVEGIAAPKIPWPGDPIKGRRLIPWNATDEEYERHVAADRMAALSRPDDAMTRRLPQRSTTMGPSGPDMQVEAARRIARPLPEETFQEAIESLRGLEASRRALNERTVSLNADLAELDRLRGAIEQAPTQPLIDAFKTRLAAVKPAYEEMAKEAVAISTGAQRAFQAAQQSGRRAGIAEAGNLYELGQAAVTTMTGIARSVGTAIQFSASLPALAARTAVAADVALQRGGAPTFPGFEPRPETPVEEMQRGSLEAREAETLAAQESWERKGQEFGTMISRYWDETAKQFPSAYEGRHITDEPTLLLDPIYLARGVIQTAPTIAAAMIPAAGAQQAIVIGGRLFKLTPELIFWLARVGAAVTGGVTGGGLEGAQTYEEILRRGGGRDQAAKGAILMGLASTGLNTLSFLKIFGKPAPGGAGRVRHVVGAGFGEAGTEALEEPSEALILGDNMLKALREEGVDVAVPAFITGGFAAGFGGQRAAGGGGVRGATPGVGAPPQIDPRLLALEAFLRQNDPALTRGQTPEEIQESGRQAARKVLERERPQFVPAPETAGAPEPASPAPPTPPPAPTTFRAGDRVRNIQTDALGTVSTAGDMTFWVRWDKGGPMDGQTTIMERSKAAGALEMAPAAGAAAPAPPVEPVPPAVAPPVAPAPPEAAESEEEAPKPPEAPKVEPPLPVPPVAKPPAPPAPPPPVTPAAFTLPRDLAGAKPRFGYGSDNYTLDFESDLDKALFTVAQTFKSPRDADYMAALRTVYPDSEEQAIRDLGRAVKDRIKLLVKGQDAAQPVRVPAIMRAPTAKPAPAPTPPPVEPPAPPEPAKPPAKKPRVEEPFDPNDINHLVRFVRARGRIAPSPSGDLVGEYADVPAHFKSKKGLSPDRMAEAIEEASGVKMSDAELLGRLKRYKHLQAQQAASRAAEKRAENQRDALADLRDDELIRELAGRMGISEDEAKRIIEAARPKIDEEAAAAKLVLDAAARIEDARGGFLSEDELVDAVAKETGRDPGEVRAILGQRETTAEALDADPVQLMDGMGQPEGSPERARALDLMDFVEELVDASGGVEEARAAVESLAEDAESASPGRRGVPAVRLTKDDQRALLEYAFPRDRVAGVPEKAGGLAPAPAEGAGRAGGAAASAAGGEGEPGAPEGGAAARGPARDLARGSAPDTEADLLRRYRQTAANPIRISGVVVPFIDTSLAGQPESLARLAETPHMRAVVDALDVGMRILSTDLASIDTRYSGVRLAAIDLQNDILGLNAPSPKGHGEIAVAPFAHAAYTSRRTGESDARYAERLSREMTETLVHELAHETNRTHGAIFQELVDRLSERATHRDTVVGILHGVFSEGDYAYLRAFVRDAERAPNRSSLAGEGEAPGRTGPPGPNALPRRPAGEPRTGERAMGAPEGEGGGVRPKGTLGRGGGAVPGAERATGEPGRGGLPAAELGGGGPDVARRRYTSGRDPRQQALPGAETEIRRPGEAAQLPLGEAQAEPRTSGETPGETFRRIEAENRTRARELDAKPVGTIMTVPGGQALGSLVGTWERVNVAGDPFWRQIEGIHKGDHKPSAMFAPHLSHQDIRITEPLRTERTTFGDQGLIPGTPGRAIPTGKIAPEESQRPIEETPLFGQKEEERRRESDEAQGRLFEPTTPYSAVPGRPELVGPAETFKHGEREPVDEAFYYHVTTAAAARRIIREGFVPGRRQTMAEGAYRDLARGKVFLTDRQGVAYWRDRIEEHLEHQYDNPPKLVVVRVSRDAVSVEPDPNRAWNEPASWVIAGELRRVEEPTTPYSALPPDEALIRRAERHYGVTEDWHEAGYVLPDGTMLDFSGRHYSSGYERKPGAIRSTPVRGQQDYLGGRRNVDHREDLSVVMPEFAPGDAAAPEGRRMRTFMDRTGAVRFHPSVPGLDFGAVPPTDAQLRVAIRAARETREPLVIDGPERQSWTFDRPTLDAVREALGETRRVEESTVPYSALPRRRFYSTLLGAVEAKVSARASAGQILATVRAVPGVKAEEIKDTGLEEWLRAQGDRPITRAEVLEYLRANEVRVEIKRLGEPDAEAENHVRQNVRAATAALREAAGAAGVDQSDIHDLLTGTLGPGSKRLTQLPQDIQAAARRMWEADAQRDRMVASRQPPRFGPAAHPTLSLPGGTGYVELLGKVPEREDLGETLAGEAAGGTPRAEAYVEPHFKESNVLFDVRGAEHLDGKERRGFFIEEVQSQWHLEGRRKGYRDPAIPPQRNYATWGAERGMSREEIDATWRTDDPRFVAWKDEQSAAFRNELAVPRAPFQKSWHERAFKEALDYALRLPPDAQGRRIEWIGWTPGQVQVDRYDLSKHVDAVWSRPIETGWDLTLWRNNSAIESRTVADGDLEANIGKEVAERIRNRDGSLPRNSGPASSVRVLSGLDLKIGGEWAYNLYDRALPNFVRGYVKKWGARVGQGHIDARDPAVMARADTLLGSIETEQPPQPIHQVIITDAMRRAVLEEGQAAFEPTSRYTRRTDATEADNRGAQQAFDFLDEVARRPVSSLRGNVLGRGPTGVPRTLGVAFDVAQINEELRRTGTIDFRGRVIDSPEALALAAQTLRTPLFETLRVYYTNAEGRIVHQESITSRLPNSATVFMTRDEAGEAQAMWERARARGAVKAWMTHNHPTGAPKPSHADVELTALLAEHMPLQGHVVTDGKQYGFIEPDGTTSLRDVPGVTEDLLLRPAVPHRLLRRKVENAEDLAALGRELSVPEGSAGVFHVGADGLIRGIQELPIADLVDLETAVSYLKESRASFGAVETLLWTTAKDPKLAWNGQFLIRQGAIADYGWTGGTAVVELLGEPGTAAMLEEAAKLRERPGPAIRVEEPTRRYEPLDALDGDLRSIETWVTNAAPRSRIAVGPVVWYRTTNAVFPWRHQAEQISTAGLLGRIQAARAAAQAKTLLPAASNADDATRQNTEAVRLGQARAKADRRAGVPPVPPITPAPATDAAVEAALSTTAVHGLPAVRDRIVEAYHMARRATTFEYDLRGFPLDRDEIRIFHGARRRALWGAKDDVAGVVGRLANLDELQHLGRIVWLRDWLSRSTLVDTLADGSTTPRYPGGLPFGLTPAQVEPELQRLLAAANDRITAAVEAHDRLMEAERVDLEARGLLDEERGIPSYAPHFVLEHQPEPGPRQPGTGQRIREPFRGFLRRTVGSEKAIETNYIRAMFQHRTEVRFADATDDFALTVLQRHDRADRLDPDVRKRLKPGQVVSSLSLVDAQGRPIPGAARYKAIQYRPGRQIFPASSIPERAIAQAIANGEESFEIEVARVRHVGALGRYFRIYVVPEAIANRFEHWGAKETEDGLRLLNNATNRWKALTIGFWGQAGNVLNLLGDVTNLSRTPAALLQLPQAAVEAARWKWGKGTDLTRLMEQYDALSAGYVTGELYFEARMPEFRQFLTHAEQAKQRALDVARTYFRDIPEYREAVPRIAMARHQLRRLAKGKSLQAGPIDIAGLTGVRGAMHLSRRFTVDYQWFTPEENRYLRGFLLPFYSWARQNTPNWLRFLWLSKIGLASFLGLRMMLEMWNNGDDDRRTVEQSLQSYERNSAHLVTGWKDKEGKMIVVFWAGDPVADALGMVGLAGTPARLSDLATERITLSQAAREQLRAFAAEPGQRVANLLTPLVKIPGEIIAGKSTLTGGDITPKSMQGTREDFWRRGRHAAESLIRPLREERQFEIASGKKGFDWLTYRYGLGLPFKRIDVEEAEMRVSTDLWYEARTEAVQEALDDARKSVDFAKLAPHQQEVELRDAADKALKAFEKATKRPVTKKRWRELEYAR